MAGAKIGYFQTVKEMKVLKICSGNKAPAFNRNFETEKKPKTKNKNLKTDNKKPKTKK